jgi:tetratricopeptide (TPR) repeat protein
MSLPRAARALSALALVLPLATLACGGAAATNASPKTPAEAAHPSVEVPAMVVSPYDDETLRAMFSDAQRAFLAGDPATAAAGFEKLLRLAPNDAALVPPSLFNAGLARQATGEHALAEAHFARLVSAFADHAATRNARVRRLRSLAYLERWEDLVGAADAVLGLGDLTPLERIEAHGARGLGLVEQDRVDEGARAVSVAQDLVETHRVGEAGTPPLEAAQAAFALGEVRRKRSERITFDPVPPNFADVLEQRCQGLLDAQAAYSEAMRSLDPHWSAMAGYRVGTLYQQLHADVMRVPTPAAADTLAKKQLFVGAMRLRYRVLLEKGLQMMEATVRLGDRTGESSAWVARAREAKAELELALAEEKAELAKLPYTEEELRAGLEVLKKKTP